ncbi:hypothetical protein [Streptomyces sp. NPDC091371]|uniref:hypothetical protein n=1 Tax=Streptomyces sp. NPDC091371 TaxID=3155303 RepID=UPI00343822B4
MGSSLFRRARRIAIGAVLLALTASTSVGAIAAEVPSQRPAGALHTGALRFGYKAFTGGWVDVRPGTSNWGSVHCPPGTSPSGGGGHVDNNSMFMLTSDPVMETGAWVVQFVNTSPNTWGRFYPVVLCTNGESYAHKVESWVNPNQETTMTSWCAPGERQSGGGFDSWSTEVRINDAFSVNDVTQQVRVTNETGWQPEVDTWVVCGRDNYIVRTASITLQAQESNWVRAYCPNGWVPTGGGGRGGQYTYLQHSEPAASGWEVRSKNTGRFPATLTAQVICAVPR